MKVRKCVLFMAVFYLVSVWSGPRPAAQQPAGLQCKIEKDFGDGNYLVKIGEKELFAITEKQQKDMLKLKEDLDAARRLIDKKDKMIAELEKLNKQYDITLSDQKIYIEESEAVLIGYKKLAQDYKKLAKETEPWLTFEAGLGATGGDTEPAVLFGLGIKGLKVWGIFQEHNSGAMIGYQFTLLNWR